MNETDIDCVRSDGDLLILFGVNDPPRGARTPGASWAQESRVGEMVVWSTRPSDGWKGYPGLTASEGSLQVRLLGELYGVPDAQRSRRILDVAAGRLSPSDLNGHFLLFAWDEACRSLRVWTDRFGTLHAYHASRGGRAAVGTFHPAVAASVSASALDWEALTGFLGFGFFPQDRTHFEDVRVLRPASCCTYDADGRLVGCERYVAWRHAPDASRSYTDTVAEFAHVFGGVMEEQLRDGRVAVPISGGLDSRSTVAEIRRPEKRYWAYSYGYSPDSVETTIAERIAQSRSLAFSAFTIGSYLFDRMDLALSSVEGFQDITQCRQAAVADEIACHADYVIAAHWGDVWLDDMGLVDAGASGTGTADPVEHALHKMEKRGRAWLLEKVARPHLSGRDPEQLLRGFVRDGMSSLEHIADPDFRVKAYKTDNWSFRWTMTSVRMYQPAAFPRLPFYDTRIADFFQTVPSELVADRRLQIDYLKASAPDLARITWQATGSDLYHAGSRGIAAAPGRIARRVRRLLGAKAPVERNWEVQFGGQQGWESLRHWLVRPGLRLHDVTPSREVALLLDAFRANPLEEGRGYTVSMLLTLSAWLERYA